MTTFTIWGRSYELFDHEYNRTALNERGAEIPFALDWMADKVLADGIEVGNVLAHYGFPAHRIIDLYEQGPGVDNSDVFDLAGSFDWILAISTLEHVGDDQQPRDLAAPIEALEHLRSLLTPGGQMLVTIPGGHNTGLDEYLAGGAGATRACTLVRSGGTWVQSVAPQFLPYGCSSPWAESVWIGEYVNDKEA